MEVVPASTPVDPHYGNRRGYDETFLGVPVPLPRLSRAALDDAATFLVGQSKRRVLPYERFSVVMSRSRKLARFTAVTIDGETPVHLGPRGQDEWHVDPRLPKGQVQNVYDGTPFDRGHLVRRLDPVWGTSRPTAEKAEADTFHFTNAAPQHENFNRAKKLWAGLEDYVLKNADLHRLRVAVFSGPVLADDDPLLRKVRIPRAFWKVVVMRKQAGALAATAYLLSQADLIPSGAPGKAPKFEFGQFRTFQVRVRDVEALAGLSFGKLRETDPLEHAVALAAAPPRLELRRLDQIVLP
jgi:endonuclease G, mitochondrial